MNQRRRPKLADIVAGKLRSDILTGRLKDGDLLPTQDALFHEYKVSLPALRESLRILESEGLITVRRGNVGGAVVHAPSPQHAADMIAMVLQTRNASPNDVSGALRQLEPMCAQMCAARADRAEVVVPALMESIEQQRVLVAEHHEFLDASAQFHDRVVSSCGNEPLIVVTRALETIWEAHASAVWSVVVDGFHPGVEPASPLAQKTRLSAVRAHAALVDAISSGDGQRAARLSRAHLDKAHDVALRADLDAPVNAGLVSDR
ncbi:FadR/GntR family transcriptional regulator [Aeromicrobium panaciterrae]|uniref:FadR/GntR family transcriptional regulator n=1 Tax=Aeromicrobium panaciterrae TaxID=363861 RepID=UPI0031D2C4FA